MTLDKKNAKLQNGSTLAYIGDAVVEVFVRSTLIRLGISDTGRFNELALNFVTAHAQSEAFAKVTQLLTGEEKEILTRGRNAKLTHRPKNQTQSDYRRATGFEALMGYLYLTGDGQRAEYLFEKSYEDVILGIKNKML
ncbi:MAG: ribonuclease III [Clostridia bacterium]|nr:ribonuclease III [Clostridia bacterium]